MSEERGGHVNGIASLDMNKQALFLMRKQKKQKVSDYGGGNRKTVTPAVVADVLACV